ncbi:MAG: 3-deoxy-D-manno-octulosonic acid transferase, partial [Alphaproteobacteria bacterium]
MIFTNIYRIISIILRPLINHWLKTRVKNGKEDSIRYIEKKGYASKIRPQGKLVWIHAVSVGESISSLSLIKELEAQGYNVLLTTSTFTSGKLMKEKLPESVIHQYCPMDVNKWVKRFLDYWKPDLAIMIESELWVNILRNLNKRNVPIFLINARMSNKTMNMWRKIPFVAKAMFSYFDYITAQTQNYADFIKGFTNVPVEMIGNLKQASPAPDVNKKDLATLQKQIGNRPVWVVASTHPQDEIFIETAINKLHKQHINLLTIIVPRHPERLNEVK